MSKHKGGKRKCLGQDDTPKSSATPVQNQRSEIKSFTTDDYEDVFKTRFERAYNRVMKQHSHCLMKLGINTCGLKMERLTGETRRRKI